MYGVTYNFGEKKAPTREQWGPPGGGLNGRLRKKQQRIEQLRREAARFRNVFWSDNNIQQEADDQCLSHFTAKNSRQRDDGARDRQ